ncbi:uncharacterized protein LOC122246593 [Penaeus japonicus]|uniref:uncharacterized protein LOC122246593 n=1 Tax=Penaeus japonicus TaxID=27405 RepID=UPI001C71659A|nr:uncharacterized protein LOC122246593 [Penaeus japonicus]
MHGATDHHGSLNGSSFGDFGRVAPFSSLPSAPDGEGIKDLPGQGQEFWCPVVRFDWFWLQLNQTLYALQVVWVLHWISHNVLITLVIIAPCSAQCDNSACPRALCVHLRPSFKGFCKDKYAGVNLAYMDVEATVVVLLCSVILRDLKTLLYYCDNTVCVGVQCVA